MKKITALFTATALLAVLTACDGETGGSVSNVPSSSALESNVPDTAPESNVPDTAPESTAPDTAPESSDHLSENGGQQGEALSREEYERITALLRAWGYLNCGLHPDLNGYCPECVDKSQYITEELSRKGSAMTYEEYFYKVTSGDYSTEEGFNAQLDAIFTESFKAAWLGSSAGQDVRFKDGETYVNAYGGHSDGQSTLGLSAQELDGNVIEAAVTNAEGETFKLTLVKTEDGDLRIDGAADGMFSVPFLFQGDVAVEVYNGSELLFTI